jgi:undecaprenyl-diphosphatase
MLCGIIIGALFTNVCIKNIVARPRPYVFWNECSEWVKNIWHWEPESEFSFPSGHTTAAMASMTPVFLFCNKKKSWAVFLFVITLGASRNYLMVHYPSDILGGIIVGGIAGLLSFIIISAGWDKLCKKGKFGQTLENADIRNLFRKKEKAA